MYQRFVREILGREKAAISGQPHGGAHWVDLLVHQFFRQQARPRASAVSHADVDVLRDKIHRLEVGIKPDVSLRMRVMKVFDSWQQPLGRKSRACCDSEHVRSRSFAQPAQSQGQPVKPCADVRQCAFRCIGWNKSGTAIGLPLKQWLSQPLLQASDELSDRGGGHMKLGRRSGKALMARTGFQCAQRAQMNRRFHKWIVLLSGCETLSRLHLEKHKQRIWAKLLEIRCIGGSDDSPSLLRIIESFTFAWRPATASSSGLFNQSALSKGAEDSS